ncbi:hypothetical protein P171DRAFT_208462 [Karstenula rhodostoma CBS 690.94]|uniref:Uncharacterized protein n=1 Tax=Karstenula rhodostoma CBS 690.94 TaxID=1392251 RepID=A0A9P4PS30_9PLEO|nr:hypothetical protein P171DRAFT_208462 [Karstenula rhodostoma CBS 690.94]
MSFLDVPQGRALAIVLPVVTLIAQGVTFVVLEAVFAESWGSSWVATYDLFAAAASVVGLLGAVHKRRMLIATYLLVHSITLSMISTVLLINVLPSSFASTIPYLSQLRHGDNFERGMCQALDDGFGWDERWLNDCASSFDTMNSGAIWAGVVMMSAQWLVLVRLASWLRERQTYAFNEFDVEKRQELGISQDYKE